MNGCKHPKSDYIGTPVKHIAHSCEVCGHDHHHCTCKGGCSCKHHHEGICLAVVDDANDRVYLYGNIIHENYHVPGNQCIAWTGVASAGFGAVGRMNGDEFFEGEQDQNTVRLKECPVRDGSLMVFLNGVKQREGNEHDYIVTDNAIHFNFYELLPTDVVEVIYVYGAK